MLKMHEQTEEKGEVIKLKIPSRPVFIRKTRQVIDEICSRSGFSEKKTKELKLAIFLLHLNFIHYFIFSYYS